jgi:hypothetical protein
MSDKTKEVSRRTLVTGAAALPAIAVLPAIADAAANPDAELLALGAQLAELEREAQALNALVAAGADVDDACGAAFCKRLLGLTDDILGRRAHSVAGLAVQTRAIIMAAPDLWDCENERHERTFIEAVCAFVGVAIPPTPDAPPLPDPILAAIATHRSAWAALSADCQRLDEEDTPEAEIELDELHGAVCEAEEALVEIEPTTLAGVHALSRYVAEFEARGDLWTDDEGIHRNLANAFERTTASAVVS